MHTTDFERQEQTPETNQLEDIDVQIQQTKTTASFIRSKADAVSGYNHLIHLVINEQRLLIEPSRLTVVVALRALTQAPDFPRQSFHQGQMLSS